MSIARAHELEGERGSDSREVFEARFLGWASSSRSGLWRHTHGSRGGDGDLMARMGIDGLPAKVTSPYRHERTHRCEGGFDCDERSDG